MMRISSLAVLAVGCSALVQYMPEPQPKQIASLMQIAEETVEALNEEDLKPKFANPEGIELLWQRPKGEPKGILLYLHGCHGRATSMWSTDGPDGFHFKACDATKTKQCEAKTEEILMRQKARKKGYVVAAVSGGVGSPRGCMNTNDVPRIQLAMKYLIEQEKDLENLPVILTGHSSGGRVLPELVATGAGIKNAKCIVPIADEIRVKGDSGAPLGPTPNYPKDIAAFFVHMENDGSREISIQSNIQTMKAKNVRTGDLKVQKLPLSPDYFHKEGYGVDRALSKKMFKAIDEAKLLNVDKTLYRNPYAVGNNWQEALNKADLMEAAGGQKKIQSYLDAAWGEHWMAGGRYFNQIVSFCEREGSTEDHSHPEVNLKKQVKEIAEQEKVWKGQWENLPKAKKAKAIAQAPQMVRK